jgi:hypothetical protein
MLTADEEFPVRSMSDEVFDGEKLKGENSEELIPHSPPKSLPPSGSNNARPPPKV